MNGKRKRNRRVESSNDNKTDEEERGCLEPKDKKVYLIKQNESTSSNDSDCQQIHFDSSSTIDNPPSTPPRGRKKTGKDPNRTVNIAVSSRALFNIEAENNVFIEKGLDEYIKLQVSNENKPLNPGSAFPFIKALENVNKELRKLDPAEEELFTVTLMSKNSAQVGIRLQKSIDSHEGLKIQRMALTGGTSPVDYLEALKITLFLTCEEMEVETAIKRGFPAAVMSTQTMNPPSDTQLRVAFDLDAVLFSDESERIYKSEGLDAFLEHEKKNRDSLLPDGPLKPFALALGKMQKKFPRCKDQTCPIRTFLVTSRDAEVGERALKTLRSWGLEIDESFFMAGAPKNDILVAINPHIFFDDQKSHIDGARQSGTPSGHVPYTTERGYDEAKRDSITTQLFEDSQG